MAPSDAIEKNRNIGAQLQSILYATAQKRFWKIYFLYDFWCVREWMLQHAALSCSCSWLVAATPLLHRVFKGFACSVKGSRPSVCPTVSVGCCSVWGVVVVELKCLLAQLNKVTELNLAYFLWISWVGPRNSPYRLEPWNRSRPPTWQVHTNLTIPSCFWTTNTKFDTCCQRPVATCGKSFI